MKIKSVTVNNKKKCIEILTAKGPFHMPFARLRLKPTSHNRISKIFVDPELANQGITYFLESGEEDSIPLDGFLDYAKDPEYLHKTALHLITCSALDLVESSQLGVREIARKCKTSPSQIYRLLDTTNYRKSLDQMFKLIVCLGVVPQIEIQKFVQDQRGLKKSA